jgi:hypothetical protein
MTGPVNPTTFTIVDALVTTENVSGFNVSFGQTAGGPYTLKAAVPAADLTNDASGSVTGAVADLNTQLAAGQWYAVATAVNAAGESLPSPEFAFQIVPPAPPLPTAPSGFSMA